MNIHNSIECVRKLRFTQTQNHFVQPFPDFLCISPNGQRILIGNGASQFSFNCAAPEDGWVDVAVKPSEGLLIALTDKDRCWLQQDNLTKLLERDGRVVEAFYLPSAEQLWGNDQWLLLHSSNHLYFFDRDTERAARIGFKKCKIIHAWMHQRKIRFLSLYDQKGLFRLNEWDIKNGHKSLISTIQYPQSCLEIIHFFHHQVPTHIHAWPTDDGGIIINLLPWALVVNSDGRITISEAPVAWHCISNAVNPLPRKQLGDLSVCALDSGFDFIGGFGSTPFLITTIESDNAIHFISTRWHKRIKKSKLARINLDDFLTKSFDHNALNRLGNPLLLLSTTGEKPLPPSAKLANAAINIVELKALRTFIGERGHLLVPAFEAMFPKKIQEIIHAEIKNDDDDNSGAKQLRRLLHALSKMPPLFPLFFDCLYRKEVASEKERETILLLIHALLPTLKKKVVAALPEDLQCQTIPPEQMVEHVGIVNTCNILQNLSPKTFTLAMLRQLLPNLTSSDNLTTKMFANVMEQINRNRKRLSDKCGEWLPEIIHIFEKALCIAPTSERRLIVLAIMLTHEIDITDHLDNDMVRLARMLQQGTMPRERLAEALLNILQSATKEDLEGLQVLVSGATTMRMLSTSLLNPIAIAMAESREELFAIPDEMPKTEKELIETLWVKSGWMLESTRKIYAKILKDAIDNCLSYRLEVANTQQGETTRRNSLTPEATLLMRHEAETSVSLQDLLSILERKESQ